MCSRKETFITGDEFFIRPDEWKCSREEIFITGDELLIRLEENLLIGENGGGFWTKNYFLNEILTPFNSAISEKEVTKTALTAVN